MLKTVLVHKMAADVSAEQVIEAISKFPMSDADFKPSERQRYGFISVIPTVDDLYIPAASEKLIHAVMKVGTKKPDAGLVKEEVTKLEIENAEKGVKVKKSELKEQVLDELIRTTTPSFSTFKVIFDIENQRLFTEGSATNFKLFLTLIGKTIEPSSFVPVSPRFSSEQLTKMITNDEAPTSHSFGGDVSLKCHSSATFSKVDVPNSESVSLFISEGGLVTQLKLRYEDNVSYTLTPKGEISGVTPLNYYKERLTDHLGDSAEAYAQIETEMIIFCSDINDIADIVLELD